MLLMLRESIGSVDKQYMTTNEAVTMKRMLEDAGLTVVIASSSGRTFPGMSGITLESDVTLADVNIADYAGCIIPCLALPGSSVKPEEVAIAKQIVTAGKPVAVMRDGIFTLAEAGALVGKRYSRDSESSSDPRFAGGIYSGDSVVQDGKIITATYCSAFPSKDQTVELTRALIAELQK